MLVSECAIQQGDHLRTAKAKHRRVNKGPGSKDRRHAKAIEIRDQLNVLVAKMSPEEKAAYQRQEAEDVAADTTTEVMYLLDSFNSLLGRLI